MTRHYSEKEVAAILKKAARASAQEDDRHAQEGLTLNELEAIGREHDIDPVAIRRAAAALDRVENGPRSTSYFGVNTDVRHVATLPGPVSDKTFSEIAEDCRRIFGARGHVRSDDTSWEWHNGNLRVVLEPDPDSAGHRLYMSSRLGAARSMVPASMFMAVVAAFIFVSGTFTGESDIVPISVIMAVASAAVYSAAHLSTRSWSAERIAQMTELGQRAAKRQRAASSGTGEENEREKVASEKEKTVSRLDVPTDALDTHTDPAPARASRTRAR